MNRRLFQRSCSIASSCNDLAEFPDTKYWWPSCMCDIFLGSRNVLKTDISDCRAFIPVKNFFPDNLVAFSFLSPRG